MGNPRHDVFKELEIINAATNKDELACELSNIISKYGMNGYGLADIPLPGEPMDEDSLLFGWSHCWMDHYNSNDYVHHDPIIRQVFHSNDPFKWSDVTRKEKLAARPQRLMNEATEFKLNDGFVIPVISITGRHSLVSFSTDQYGLSPDDEGALCLIALYAHRKLKKIGGKQKYEKRERNAGGLTTREKECIRWAADGKTYEDIGDILGISRKMVEVHMSRASQKMLTYDKAHLVAESIRHGIIS